MQRMYRLHLETSIIIHRPFHEYAWLSNFCGAEPRSTIEGWLTELPVLHWFSKLCMTGIVILKQKSHRDSREKARIPLLLDPHHPRSEREFMMKDYASWKHQKSYNNNDSNLHFCMKISSARLIIKLYIRHPFPSSCKNAEFARNLGTGIRH